ncbi:MAG: CRTAC1 family protein [Holophagales bacterium]|nr:CRTAC1 family protein [Holophagales bacterium]MYD22333.1 CRTAC1 family protein [Holophagales bacterium]MYI34127.1 CRTAC1 family protein [Holophagales bacterium]
MPPTPRALVTVLISTVGVLNCAGEPRINRVAEPVTSGSPSRPTEPVAFDDRAAEVGLAFQHRNGGRGRYLLPEIMGSGAALFDADGDGDLDAYLVQGGELEPGAGAAGSPARDRLFRNDLLETGELRFVDATEDSGLSSTGYGMGVAAGDFDGDGRVDLYVTNLGPNRLWRNVGNGRFEDVTEVAEADDPRWSVPAAFFDYDGDDMLDLFVANYVDFNLGSHTLCTFGSGEPDYCSPKTYRAEPDRLFRNLGDGRFEQTTDRAGLATQFGNGLGAVPADLDLDGRLDLYVANDGTPNQMWMNRGGGRFENRALFGGSAVNRRGEAEAGMGVDAGDLDGDGDEDLYVTHITGETSTLYLNDGDGLFTDAGLPAGLDVPSLPMTGFGTGWFDFDNDGDLDLLAVNGAVRRLDRARSGDAAAARAAAGSDHERRFGQPNQLFRNLGDGRFEDASSLGGPAFAAYEVSRGAAFGDVDNDGDTDVLITNNNGPARLLLNLIGQDSGWIGLRLVTSDGKRDAVGSLARVRLTDGRTITRRVRAAMSYASSSDPRVLIGLGFAEVEDIRVDWRGGAGESFGALSPHAYHEVRQGESRQ